MEKGVVLKNFQDGSIIIDTLHLKAEATHCNDQRCVGSIVVPDQQKLGEPEASSKIKEEALNFLEEYFQSIQCVNTPQSRERVAEVVKEIDKCGSYELTEKELTYGARLAWRNASRCIGRIQWKKLHVFDCRHVTNAQQMFECCLQHLRFATNKGSVRAAISVFPQQRSSCGDFRIWNAQLIRYAGYKQDDGTVIGDPSSVEITKIAESLGWIGKGTKFDVLPLIIQANGENPEMFEIPKEYVLEVNIQHPKHRELDQLGLRWYAIPVISNMALSCGGLTFTAIPFNGWYMSTEISVRNFGDESRYNLLKPTAKLLGYNTSTNISLWKDRAIIELTTAIMHSYQAAGVTMVDHHSSAESFMKHFHQENKLRGGCPSDWVWIVPPLSGSTCPVFHQEMLNYKLKPAYEYQTDPWRSTKTVLNQLDVVKKRKFKQLANFVKLSTDLMSNVVAKRHKVTILYASESGKAEAFAYTLHELFLNAFNSKVVCMDQYNVDQLENEKCIFVVASTTGNGEAPENGEAFGRKLYEMVYPSDKVTAISGIHHPQNEESPSFNESIPILFSVFGLGSKAYPYFCAFAKSLNKLLKAIGGEEIYPIGEGDELCGQEQAFRAWSQGCFKATCEAFSIQAKSQSKTSPQISTDDFRIVFPESFMISSLDKELIKFHRKAIETCKIISVSNLQTKESNRVTNLVRIDKLHNKELSYCPGDNLGIYACNNMELVDRLICRVTNNKLTSSTVVDLVTNEDMKKTEGVFSKSQMSLWKSLPLPNTLGRIFGWFLDITTPPSMKLLEVFANRCKNQKEKAMLTKLARISNIYEDWKHSSYPNIADVLEEFSSIEIDFVLLANELPLLKPRYYSISSSPDVYPNEIHITVALISYSVNEIPHNGVCSSWLHSRNAGNEVYCFIRKTPTFHMPSHPATPMIMVGPGTGIAPFRSFWQQRMFDKLHQKEVEFGEMFLFFGCRNKYQDNIYGSELEDAKHQALTEVFVGCSRQSEERKTYVQDLLKANSKLVLEYFLKKEGHVYVCGDVTMASDVQKAMLGLIKESLKCSEQECKSLYYDIKKNGRYHEEIFGVTSNIRNVTSRVRSVLNRYKKSKEPCKSSDEKIKLNHIHSSNKMD